jgi:ABC-type Fe3+-hydroxamate transport system substrate-binding protein
MKFQDQIGRTLELRKNPKRIICLVPSLTELLFDLGLEDYVVGITELCVRPERLKQSNCWLNKKY